MESQPQNSLFSFSEAASLWKVSLEILNSDIVLKTFIHVSLFCLI